MKKYRFITIEPDDESEDHCDHLIYKITNNKSKGLLGIIFWYPPWKQWVFTAEPTAVFNNSCLHDIIDFIEKEIPKETV